MKLTTFIMIITLAQVSAKTFSQNITLEQKNVSLKSVLKSIEAQSGYVFLSTDYDLNKPRINVSVKNATIEEALLAVLKDVPLTYKIVDNSIVLSKKEPFDIDRHAGEGRYLQNIDVHGKILDSEGKGLPGASVKVKSTGKAVSTDAKGNFFLRGVEEGAVLIVSFIGCLPKEVNASANLGNIVLEQSLSKLDEIQVIAYGTTTQRLSTGNVTTIKADVIEKQPVNNPLLALQGRVPGLFIEQATGFAGTGVKVRIQGTNSMANGNDPLYVIDGIPYLSQLLSDGNPILNGGIGSGGSGIGSPLNFINPADIESIDVLKDADATAIYGSRAANGAILITTKKGKAGETKVEVNMQTGIGRVANMIKMLNTPQYLKMRHEALKNDGITSPGRFDFDLNGTWDTTRNVNWQKELIGGTAKYNDIQMNISGGNVGTQFLIGAGYHRETTVFPDDFADMKGSLHFSINNTSRNQKFKIQFSGSYMLDRNLLPSIDLTTAAVYLAPLAPKPYNTDGSLNWEPDASGASTFRINPFSPYKNTYKSVVNSLNFSSLVGYEVIPGLKINSSFGYRTLITNGLQLMPLSAIIPEYQPFLSPSSNFTDNKIDSWIIEPTITFNKNISKGKLDVLIGTTIQQNYSYSQTINGFGYISDLLMEDLKSAAYTSVTQSINSVYKYNALYGRASYNWDNKYIANITVRRDGSSRFGPESQFHNFGAVGVAWVFSQEPLIKAHLPYLSFGKLRLSYGTTGSDQIGDYRFMNLYDSMIATIPYQNSLGLSTSGLSNPYLQWEETRKLQMGLDFGLFNDRILVNVNYNRNRSSNQLVSFNLPLITGATFVARNLPAVVQNTGWELMLSNQNIKNKNFRWTSSINLTIPRNKLLSYSLPENSSYVLNQPLSIIHAYSFAGMNKETGQYQFVGNNGKVTSTPSDPSDKNTLINIDPKFYGGFQNSLNYKSFSLDFLISFTKQNGFNPLFGSGLPPGLFSQGGNNQPISVLDRWQKPGDDARYQFFTTGYSNGNSLTAARFSNIGYSDISYMKLKNLAISWKIPENWTKSMHLRVFNLFAQGQNLLTITKFKGLDPESGGTGLPPLRVITFGAKIVL